MTAVLIAANLREGGDPLILLTGDALGSLAALLQEYMVQHPDLSERQIAVRCGLPQQTFRKIRRGQVVRPHTRTLEGLSRGTGIPLRKLREAAARNVDKSYVIEELDITTPEALQIAIARIREIPEEELPELKRQAQEILHQILKATEKKGT